MKITVFSVTMTGDDGKVYWYILYDGTLYECCVAFETA